MKKTAEFKRMDMHQSKIKGTMILSYYALSIADTTGIINDCMADDLFVSYQNGFLEVALDELKKKNKRMAYQIIDEGNNTAKVLITMRPLWQKR